MRIMSKILFDLYRNDEILCDREMNRFSLDVRNQNSMHSETDFDLCSDRMVLKNPTYVLDEECKAVPGPKAKTLDFFNLKSLLLSKNLTLDATFSKRELCFLDGQRNLEGNMIAFQSFPRTGNTFLR